LKKEKEKWFQAFIERDSIFKPIWCKKASQKLDSDAFYKHPMQPKMEIPFGI